MLEQRAPRILLFDIETSYATSAHFTPKTEYVPYTNRLTEATIISAAWKWLDEKKVHSASVSDDIAKFTKDRQDDKDVVLKLKEAIEQADCVVSHNGDKFDIKWFFTRCLFHYIDEPPQPKSIDTLKIAKKYYNFHYNNLDYLGQYLKCGNKIRTHMDMWLCIVDTKHFSTEEALKLTKEMVKYNKQDVVLLENVFNRMKHKIHNLPNHNLYTDDPVCRCPGCGSDNIHRGGFYLSQVGKYQRLKCNTCAKWFLDRRVISTTNYK